jgi:anti-sigma B factor antagonist
MPLPLQIDTKQMEPDITVVEFAGRITMGPDSRRMETLIEDLLRKNQKKFIFDMTGVDYVDSSGMGSIAHCFTQVRHAQGGFRIAGLNGRVQQLFKITRMDTILAFYPTVAAAAESPW